MPFTASTDDILGPLTPAQREAVQHVDGPLLILAGPGSGKTRVITHRVAHLLLRGIAARHILALTFTNKAADEMRLRLDRLAPHQPVWVGTFHRFCSRMLRMHAPLVGLSENFSIYDTDDSRKVIAQTMEEAGVADSHFTPDQIARSISWAKNHLIDHHTFVPSPGSPVGAAVARVFPLYQKRLLASSAVDFDDLLVHTAVLLRENPELRARMDERYRYIMVDEYQDTNLAQYLIVRSMSVDWPNLAVTGDPDQSIYGWRGANLKNILDFEHDFPQVKVVRLEQNYRSTGNILLVADSLIAHNKRRKPKRLLTDKAEGPPVRLVAYPKHLDEAEHIASQIADEVTTKRRRPRDFAIFYRVNALSRSLEDALRSHGLPYQIVRGVEFYQRQEIKDVLAYLQLLNNPRDEVALRRIINVPRRNIGKTTLERVSAHARRFELTLLDAARESGLIESIPKRAAVSVAAFVALYDRLRLVVHESVETILGHVLHETGYRKWLAQSDSETDNDRLANVEELIAAAREFDQKNPAPGALEAFLEQTCLVNDADDWDSEIDRVTMMTMHAAKGLEFPVVYIVALEEGILPHSRSRDDSDKLEEERRLLFVGITRAEEQLQLSFAKYRPFRGALCPTIPSEFLPELPRDRMEWYEPSSSVAVEVRGTGEGVDELPPDAADYEESDDGDSPERRGGSRSRGAGRSGGARRSAGAAGRRVAGASSAVVTAAQLQSGDPVATRRVSPEIFHHAMVVVHPEYGAGRIVALSGEGERRTATVEFFGGCGQKKFRLAFSPLRPVRSPG
jgi:DNA helicase-2/ATP-dependent DNA helicase PcrA